MLRTISIYSSHDTDRNTRSRSGVEKHAFGGILTRAKTLSVVPYRITTGDPIPAHNILKSEGTYKKLEKDQGLCFIERSKSQATRKFKDHEDTSTIW